MARPKKNNADYFSHDNNMRNDPKIKALRRKYQATGYMVFTMMLEVLTEAENFTLNESPMKMELLAGDFDVEPEILMEIIDYCVRLELLFRDETGLYSQGLKKRLQSVIDHRNAIKERFLQKKLQQQGVSSEETQQSKVKESKVNNSNINTKGNSVADAPTPEEKSEPKKPVSSGKEKSSAKKESPGLVRAKTSYQNVGCTFSATFKNIWLKLCEAPKWKNKPQSAVDYNLRKLMEYEEAFAISLCEHSIRGNYQGVVFDNTDEKYQKYLISKNGNSTNTKFKSPSDRKQSRDNLGALADGILAGVAPR